MLSLRDTILNLLQQKQSTQAAKKELCDVIDTDPVNARALFQERFISRVARSPELGKGDVDILLEKLCRENNIPVNFTAGRIVLQPAVHHIHFLKRSWLKYAAAIIILAGVGSYFYFFGPQKKAPATVSVQPDNLKNDIAPGGDKAVLTLADGRTIVLDSAGPGQLAEEAGAKVIKTAEGKLEYYATKEANKNAVVSSNTMTTPKGGQYQLRLPDGSQVWLNAASSITYPTMFAGKEREVTITGEVYFEIIQNSKKPFIVKTIKEEITVLGTSFNVNSYADEPASKTSLLEGSVKVNNTILKPGEAYVNGKISKTNIEQDIAWKKGMFYFNDADLATVMRQISRWYDIEVYYEAQIAQRKFEGKLYRELSLSEVLNVLKAMRINFRIDGRNLYITNKPS